MPFIISKNQLSALQEETKTISLSRAPYMYECPGGSCGNNCSGTCATSPCTNLCAATSH